MASLHNLTIRGATTTDGNIGVVHRQNAVFIDGLSGVEVAGCWFEGLSQSGVYVTSASVGTVVTENSFKGCGGDVGDVAEVDIRAAVFDGGVGTAISVNTLRDNEVDNLRLAGSNTSCTGNTMAGGARGEGRYFIRDSSSGSTVTGNTACDGGGFFWGFGAMSTRGTVVSGNSCSNAFDPTYNNSSVVLYGCKSLTFSGNFIQRMAINDALQCLVSGNMIYLDPTDGPVLEMTGTTRNVSVLGNKFRRASDDLGGDDGKVANCIHLWPGTSANMVGGNDFYDAYLDTPILDEGSVNGDIGNFE